MLAVGYMKTRPNPRVPDPTGRLGNLTQPIGYLEVGEIKG